MAAATLGTLLWKLRRAKKLDKSELADRMQVSVPYISFIEADQVIPSQRALTELSKHLDGDLQQLLRLRAQAEVRCLQ